MCVSVRWVTLWVRPPPCENICVRSLGYIVGSFPPSVKICVSVRWVTLWVRPPDIVARRRSDYCRLVAIFSQSVPPCENMCVRSLGYIVGASPRHRS